MNTTRIAVSGVALVAGVAAFFLMMNNRPAPPAPVVERVEEKTVRVLTADREFTRGERLVAENLRFIDWPEKALSESYLTESSTDIADLDGAVARVTMVAGEPILESKIVRAGSSGLMAAILTPGMQAVTMRISPETAAGGFVLPGDRVDILYTETDGSKTKTKTLFERVRVLAINNIYAEETEAPYIEGSNMTLEFTPPDAARFVNARSGRGQLSLTLRSVFRPEGELEDNRTSQDVTIIRYGRS